MVTRTPDTTPPGDVPVTADDLWAAGVEAVAAANTFLDELHLPDDDLLVEDASTRALLALAGEVLTRHRPETVCGLTLCTGQLCTTWPCPLADLALRAVGALARGVADTHLTSTPGASR